MTTISALGVLSVHWSPRIRRLVDELREQIDVAYRAWVEERAVAPYETGGTRADPLAKFHVRFKRFEDAKERISAIDLAVRDQVQAELSGKHDGHAD